MNLKLVALRGVGLTTRIQVLIARLVVPVRTTTAGLAESVLVVRLDETIGDTVMFSPFLRELRLALPQARITLVVNHHRVDMYRHCPHVDEVVATRFGCAASRSIITRPFGAIRFVRRALGARRFDIAFVPRVDYDHNAAFIGHASGAPRRVGYAAASTDRKRVVNAGMDALFTDLRTAEPHTHEVDRHLALLDILGHTATSRATEVWIGPDDIAAADAVITDETLDRLMVIAPTGGHSELKQWPIERYDTVAAELLAAGHRVAMIGGPGDAGLADGLSPAVRASVVNLAGRLSVMGTAALIARAEGFVGADSGMSHVAAAVGTRTVAVFGPTCTHTFAPLGARAAIEVLDLPCGPCSQAVNIDRCATCVFDSPKCMSGVDADRVLARLDALR